MKKNLITILSIVFVSLGLIWYSNVPKNDSSEILRLKQNIIDISEQVAIISEQIKNEFSSSQLGAFNPSGGLTYRLQTSIGTTDTTINLSSFKNRSGIALTLANLDTDKIYGTLSPQTSRSEFVSCTGITQNANGTASLTSCTRGLSDIAPFTASSTLRQSHPGQSVFILSDSPNFFEEYARVRNNQYVSGNWLWASTSYPGYTALPTAHSLGNPASSTAEFASVGYVNAISIAGASNASESAKGISELATAIEQASSTVTGTTGANLVLQAKNATSSPGTTGLWTVITRNSGKIAQSFFDLTESFSFSSISATLASFTHATTTTSWGFGSLNYRPPTGTSYTASSTILSQDGAGKLSWINQDWQLLVSTTTQVALDTPVISFSQRQFYKININLSTSTDVLFPCLIFNNDNGTRYSYKMWEDNTIYSAIGTDFRLRGVTSTTPATFFIDVDNSTTTGSKRITWNGVSTIGLQIPVVLRGAGIYTSTTSVTSIGFTGCGGSAQTGANSKIEVYGSRN